MEKVTRECKDDLHGGMELNKGKRIRVFVVAQIWS
jgi:hypothetical protein